MKTTLFFNAYYAKSGEICSIKVPERWIRIYCEQFVRRVNSRNNCSLRWIFFKMKVYILFPKFEVRKSCFPQKEKKKVFSFEFHSKNFTPKKLPWDELNCQKHITPPSSPPLTYFLNNFLYNGLLLAILFKNSSNMWKDLMKRFYYSIWNSIWIHI